MLIFLSLDNLCPLINLVSKIIMLIFLFFYFSNFFTLSKVIKIQGVTEYERKTLRSENLFENATEYLYFYVCL